MSGIFGIVHLDGSPVLESELTAMRSAMQEWGRDAGKTWIEGSAGLGSLVTFDTPEAVNEKLPQRSSRGFVLTAEARLDNRTELLAELAIPAIEHSRIADGDLILRLYEQWGDAAPTHLLGDWSLAAWHPREKRLFLARDHFGNTGLYYYCDERRFAFASSRQAIFALGIPRRLNEFFLACVLVSWPAHYGEQTIELDLHRLPPAHALSLSDGRSHLTKYWRLEDTPALRLRRSEEYVEGFLSIYDRAVRDRLRSTGKIGISLSGGLDSGSTAALAARALRERGGRLLAYTSIPARAVAYAESKRTLGDEWRLAQATATTAGNVDLIAVDARDVTPIQGVLRTLRIHAEPGHAASNHFWIRKLLDTAAQDGVKTLLTGQGGNATVSWSGANRTRMALRLLKRRSWKRALQLLIYPLLPVPLLRGARHLLHRGGLDWSGTSISPDFAARIHLSAEYIQNTGNVTNGEEWHAPIHQRWSTIRPGASFIGSIWAESGAAHGLDVLDATFDKRVMEFALSIPDREYAPADSQDRWVIRSAMQGLLPDEVRLNRRQGLQAADLGWRLIDSASEVEQALASIESSQLARQYLSVDRMRLVWDSVQQEITPWAAHSAITILMRGIMAGLHLVDRERMD